MTSSSPKSNLCQACQAVITDTGPLPRKRRIELTAAAPEPDKDALAPTADDEYSDDEFDVPIHRRDLYKMEENETGYFRDLADIYARLGLHFYNFRKGTNFQFSRVDKFINYGIFNYYITMEATDPADGTGEIIHRWEFDEEVYKNSLPDWYSDDALLPSSDQFYQVQDSDMLENDWLNLYAEVAMYALQENDSMSLFESWLPLEIKKVVVQTFEEVKSKEKLKAANAIFYFSFKNLNAPTHGLCQDHRVIVRRSTDGLPGHICLDINSCTGRNIFK
ncbi:unnamed protein product [Brassica oleracea var. botrytis]|uniref:Uncharacterized protein n=3 Tax=Brassica TaxID=3705 RepID=A0A0D3A3F6_BRAOL|nr:unnamed protein product [Brassica napus]VDD48565.1 unnamed protein product [Brassica oleracea]